MTPSSSMQTASSSLPRASSAAAWWSSGMSATRASFPLSSALKYRAFIESRSMMPLNSGPSSIGIVTATGVQCSRWAISSNTRPNSAPMRSILLMKQIRGTP